jgi:hypothetical protein
MQRCRPTIAFALLAALVGCQSEIRPQIVVSINTDLTVPQEIDALLVDIDYRNQRVETLSYSLVPDTRDAVNLPGTLVLTPKDDPALPVTICAKGRLSGTDVVTRCARLPFAKGRVLHLPLALGRACLFRSCADEQTCIDGRCVDPDIDPNGLADYDPNQPAKDASSHETGLDGGTTDGGDEAAFAKLAASLTQKSELLLVIKPPFYQWSSQSAFYWATREAGQYELRRWTRQHGRTSYAFAVDSRSIETRKVAFSDQMIVFAKAALDKLVCQAFDANEQDSLLGEVTVADPLAGFQISPVAAFERTLYAGHWALFSGASIHRWSPGETTLTEVKQLGPDGLTTGLIALSSSKKYLLMAHGELLYRLDKATNALNSVDPETVSGISMNDEGVCFTNKSYQLFCRAWDASTIGPRRDIAAELAANAYRVTPSHQDAHHWSATGRHFVRLGDQLIYVGKLGLFVYHLQHKTIRPLFLLTGSQTLSDPAAIWPGEVFFWLKSGAESTIYRISL